MEDRVSDSTEYDRQARLARVTARASAVLDGAGAAAAFLLHPHPLFDGATPLEVAETEEGARRVEAVLDRLEHGLPV